MDSNAERRVRERERWIQMQKVESKRGIEREEESKKDKEPRVEQRMGWVVGR